MSQGLAVLGVLLALQVAGVQWYYKQKYGGLDPSTCAVSVELGFNAANASGGGFSPFNDPPIKVLHEDARIFLYENFLTPKECDYIISLAEPHIQRSGVVDSKTGATKIDNVRTSKGMFLRRGHDSIISDIEQRIAKWTLMPVGNGEGLQVLKYEAGQEYEGHFDYFFDAKGTVNGGNRYLTVLMYLNTVEEGGETCFPNIPVDEPNGPEFSECAHKVLAVKPQRGNAVLFHSIKPTGELERRSLHTACPVISGSKWSAPKWVHVGHYATGSEKPEQILQKPQVEQMYPDCTDVNEMCEQWASNGECENNPAFMTGTSQVPGQCIKSCGKCAEMAAIKANAEAAQATESAVQS